jgi:hypothetical protein
MNMPVTNRFKNRVMPSIHIPSEDEPPIRAKPERRSVQRPFSINTPVTNDHYTLLVRLTEHFRQTHGRSWRQNATVEMALEALARQEGIPLPQQS